MLKPEGPYPRQSAAERKMRLYDDIISYFDKGKVSSISCIVVTPLCCVSLSAMGVWYSTL